MQNLVLIRHGETVGKSSERLYGQTDIELSDIGKKQMQLAGQVMTNEVFDFVITSPLIRSIVGAKLVLNGRSFEPVVIEDFTEINFGAWEGLTIPEVELKDPDKFKEWKLNGLNFRFPDGDYKKDFFNQIQNTAIREFNNRNGNILAVLHKGVIKGVISALLEKPLKDMEHYYIELGSIHRLYKNSHGWKLATSNETNHLKEYRIPASR